MSIAKRMSSKPISRINGLRILNDKANKHFPPTVILNIEMMMFKVRYAIEEMKRSLEQNSTR